MSFTFPKKEKLKSKKLIERLFSEGQGISKYPIKLFYLETALPEEVRVQAGVTASKRNFKSAVARNRIKRLLREAYRLNKPLLFNNIEGNYALMFLYIGKEMPTQEKITETMVLLIQKFSAELGKSKLGK
ncbi:ribonuclease P protein component [Arenibacter nanhaiticus]|uniref:Ribonuclease P protein component n=1 Tax=Arenibacter nanhaiticus TaxID=558155 RepID=A0A1M6LUF8_9FLAO|nr:ribonuclease P protein component [Arenibacter nanhaiticus]SHJ74809.1 ribonuclease P protein component [Arenibacter nanhaiticus]